MFEDTWMCGESWLIVKDLSTHHPSSQGWASLCPLVVSCVSYNSVHVHVYVHVCASSWLCVCCLSVFFSLLLHKLVCYTHVCSLSLCSVHWEEPEVQYRGDIEYEIYLGQRALEPDEETKKNIDTDNNDVRS